MKAEATIHVNKYMPNGIFSNDRKTAVYGFELEPGDVLEETDVYESTGGFWEACVCPGLTLQANAPCRWVRPCLWVRSCR